MRCIKVCTCYKRYRGIEFVTNFMGIRNKTMQFSGIMQQIG